MNLKFMLAAAGGAALCAAVAVVYISGSLDRTYRAEVMKGLQRARMSEASVLSEADLVGLPEPVRRYLEFTGVVGKEKVRNVRIAIDGQFRVYPDGEWGRMKIDQYDFFGETPARLSRLSVRMKGLPVAGLDTYLEGRGRMQVRPFGLFTVADARGRKEDDLSAAAILLSEMCIAAPATLVARSFSWDIIDLLTVQITWTAGGERVSGILTFDGDTGALTNFSTGDKYFLSGTEYRKVLWSTPVREYRDFNGIKLATYGEGIWHFPEGDFCYGKLTAREIEYNSTGYR